MSRLISPDRVAVIERLCRLAPAEGVGAEVGVYQGGSLRHIAQAMTPRRVFGFDTFSGLPVEHWHSTEIHLPGDFADTSLCAVAHDLRDLGNVFLVPGLFPDSTREYHRLLQYAFVHLDVDFYAATKACLEWFWSRMLPGGIIVVDDYEWPQCPGVARALDEFGKPIASLTKYQAHLFKPTENPSLQNVNHG